jgi:hypothetical protein
MKFIIVDVGGNWVLLKDRMTKTLQHLNPDASFALCPYFICQVIWQNMAWEMLREIKPLTRNCKTERM